LSFTHVLRGPLDTLASMSAGSARKSSLFESDDCTACPESERRFAAADAEALIAAAWARLIAPASSSSDELIASNASSSMQGQRQDALATQSRRGAIRFNEKWVIVLELT